MRTTQVVAERDRAQTPLTRQRGVEHQSGRRGREEPAGVRSGRHRDEAAEHHRDERDHLAALPEQRAAVDHEPLGEVHERFLVEEAREEDVGGLEGEDPGGDQGGPRAGELVDGRREQDDPDHREGHHLRPQHELGGLERRARACGSRTGTRAARRPACRATPPRPVGSGRGRRPGSGTGPRPLPGGRARWRAGPGRPPPARAGRTRPRSPCRCRSPRACARECERARRARIPRTSSTMSPQSSSNSSWSERFSPTRFAARRPCQAPPACIPR